MMAAARGWTRRTATELKRNVWAKMSRKTSAKSLGFCAGRTRDSCAKLMRRGDRGGGEPAAVAMEWKNQSMSFLNLKECSF
jgi:hypothetical protein